MKFTVNLDIAEWKAHASSLIDKAKESAITYLHGVQRKICVAAVGIEKTATNDLIQTGMVFGIGASATVYGLYKFCTAKSHTQRLAYGVVTAAGVFVAWNEFSRTFSDLTDRAIASCTGGYFLGNQFPGAERCATIALGTFGNSEGRLRYGGIFSCPTIAPR